jgi:hypothetical protein
METNVGFTQIGLTAALILNKLRNQAQLTEEKHRSENEDRTSDSDKRERPENHPDEHRKYVEHRLRELRAWERNLGGKR